MNDDTVGEQRPRWPVRPPGEEERLPARLAQQWAQRREVRREGPAQPVDVWPSNTARAQVPWGVDLAAAWAWRFLVIVAAGYVLARVVAFFSVLVLPLVVALLIAALVSPVVAGLDRAGFSRGAASGVVVLSGLAMLVALLTFAGQQVAAGAADLADSTARGLGEVRTWLRDGPLNASESQINDYIARAEEALQRFGTDTDVLRQVTDVTTALGHVVAGLFIALFATFFFLSDGRRIWGWLVRLAPRDAREHVDGSGRVAWVSLTQFVRATVIVALVDALGIAIWAAVLGVPFVLAIGVLVFLGAFVPLVGATVAGAVAVLVALVDQGPVTALLMLVGVIVVQQIEGHLLQPFLMGRWVSVHPLGVIVGLAAGVLAAGIPGALVAVPLVAAGNAVVLYLAAAAHPERASPDPEDSGGPLADPAPEPSPDAHPDAQPDGQRDAPPDAPPDATSDVTSDVTSEGATDA